jgi:hypothetical protein
MPYTAARPVVPPSAEELRARIPGWGADLDPADRPAVPQEVPGIETGAHWELPEQQPELTPRERSIEHLELPRVFGTSVPLKGVSGAIRRHAYARYSEARAAHWLLLIAADRVDAVESHLASFATSRPDNPLTETGIRAELTHHGLSSRTAGNRVDAPHQALDPFVVAGPWVVAAGLAVLGVDAARRRARSRAAAGRDVGTGTSGLITTADVPTDG